MQNTPLQVHTYNVLLHLCSGGNQQGEAATRVHPAESNEVCSPLPSVLLCLTCIKHLNETA